MSEVNLSWTAAILAVLFTASGHIMFKWGKLTLSKTKVALGLVLLGTATAATFLALRSLSVGQVFMLTALTPVFTTLAGMTLMRETVTLRSLLAIVACCSGVLIYQLGR